jgi:hypothetical protein
MIRWVESQPHHIQQQIELQELYFSGHRHFHAIHTQVIIDNAGYICYAEARFLGHQNDAKQLHSSLVHGHRSSLYSFIVGHCIKRYNALFRIGIHSFISL